MSVRLILLALVLVASSALAEPLAVIPPWTAGRDLEPTLAEQACLPVVDPSRCAADDNGQWDTVAEEPAIVLQVRFRQAGVLPHDPLLSALTGRGWLVGSGWFEAWYGLWHDVNQDGVIDVTPNNADVVVDADLPRGQRCSLRPVVAPSAGAHSLPIRSPCPIEREFLPLGFEIVMYITPGRHADVVNGPLGPDLGGSDPPSDRDPDVRFRYVGPYHVSPASGFPILWTDNGLLQATLTEAITRPSPSAGARSMERTRASLVDADLYHSVDQTVGTLYDSVARDVWYSRGVYGLHPDGAWSPTSLRDPALVALGPAIGPAFAKVVPPRNQDFPRYYGEEPPLETYFGSHQPYFNAWIDEALRYEPLVAVASDRPSVGLAPWADGREGVAALLGVYAAFGAWKDANYDGWIGEAPTACDDGHACGTIQDPNRYTTLASADEFRPSCAPQNPHSLYHIDAWVHPLSSDGGWGAHGAYVITDERDGPDGEVSHEWRTFSANPYDDVVLDPLDGSADRLVLSGPIRLHLNCVRSGGSPYYASYEHVLLPSGTRTLGVRLDAGPVSVVHEGVRLADALRDEDVLPALGP